MYLSVIKINTTMLNKQPISMKEQRDRIKELLFDMWNEFQFSDDSVTFEMLYENWKTKWEQAELGTYFPEFNELDYAINNAAVTQNKFNRYFVDYFYSKYN